MAFVNEPQLSCCVMQNWASLAAEKPVFLGSPDDEDYMLRRAAIVTQQTLHLFDLDAKPPVCKVFPPLPSTYKAQMQFDGHRKSTHVKTAAWSLVLGKDPLPKAIILSGLHTRVRTIVMLKEGGSMHVCRQRHDSVSAPGLQHLDDQKKLSLTFGTAEYVQDQLAGKKRKQSGPRLPSQPPKRGRPSTKRTGELSTLLQSGSCHVSAYVSQDCVAHTT